jgi:hypothetical protein
MAGPESLERRLVLDSTVVFNEIMYNPLDDPNDELEWIELHNQLAVDMDVSAWRLEGGVEFDFPADTIVPGKGYLVVAADPAALTAATGITNVIGPFSGKLNNAGEELRLFNIDGRRMNVLDYSDNSNAEGIWPVEADGGGASLAKADPLTNSRDSENWTFSAQIGGTPGVANVVSDEDIQLNEIAGADDGSFFIEIANDGPSSVNVGGYVLSATGLSGGDYVLPSQTIASGGVIVVDGGELGFSPADGQRLFLYGSAEKEQLIDARVVTNTLRGRSEAHDAQWLWPDVPTSGGTNSFAFHDEIVINEIMYHAPPQLRIGEAPFDDAGEQPYAESDEEWIELYNRGSEAVDLSGWQLRDAVNFNFAAGTSLAAGEYLVVAWDAAAMAAKYPGIDIAGEFSGGLSNKDDRILLRDASKNPADEVHYYERGTWDEFADGGGSSLELRDVDSDNNRGAAWAASDETSKSEWTEYTYRGTALEPLSGVGGMNEWVFGMLDASEILLDDVSLVKNPAAVIGELAVSGGFDTEADLLDDWVLTNDVQWAESGAARVSNVSDPPGFSILSQFVPSTSNVRYRIEFDIVNVAPEAGSTMRFRVRSAANQDVLSIRSIGSGHHSFDVTARDGTLEVRFFLYTSMEGHSFEVDNVSVKPVVDQLIRNGTFEDDTIGATPAEWRFNGNHSGTVIVDPTDPTNQVVHVVSSGAQQFVHDNVETTISGARSGDIFEVSFRAKWLTGGRQLNNRLFFTALSNTAVLDAPQLHGTPGAENSTIETNVGPTYTEFGHFPVLPRSNQTVTVSARPSDPDGVTSMTLWWSEMTFSDGTWNSVTMTSDSTGLYTAAIPGQSTNDRIQFYVEGRDSLGAISTYPAEGRGSRAMYQVDSNGQETQRPVDTFRMVLRRTDENAMFGNRYQQMTNLLRGATLIFNGETAFYDVGMRLIGSGFIRPNSGYKVQMNPEQRFYGVHDSIRFDIDLIGEIIHKQMVNGAGGSFVSMYDDVSYLVSPRHNTLMQLQLARYEGLYLGEQFENGTDGTKFELDDVTYPTGIGAGGFHTSRSMAAQDICQISRCVTGEDFRGQLLIKSNRARDDMDAMARLSLAIRQSPVSLPDPDDPDVANGVGSPLDLATKAVMDVDLWMRHYATQAFIGNWDTYGFGRPKNLRIYTRPDDGMIIPFYWDADHHRITDAIIYNGSRTRLDEIRNIPTNTRLFWGHMWDLTNRAFNKEYAKYWDAEFRSLGMVNQHAPQDSPEAIGNRANQARNQAKSTIPEIDFHITHVDGTQVDDDPISTTETTVEIRGDGWIDVRQIRFAGSDTPLDVTWTDNNSWKITLPVAFGENTLSFEAYDFEGIITGSDSILVTSSSDDLRVADVLRLSEVMYNPADPPSDSIHGNDDFEYIELVNTSNETIDLRGVEITGGITFSFTGSAVESLVAGERVVVVRNLAAFHERYGDPNIPFDPANPFAGLGPIKVAGAYSGKLDNGGEDLAMVDSLGGTAFDFEYRDGWYNITDGDGFSLNVRDTAADPASLTEKSAWQPSSQVDGTPGREDNGPVLGSVIINEILTHTDDSDVGDWIELYNTTTETIDLSGWYLSDSGGNLRKYRIPNGTMILAGGYVTFDQFGTDEFGKLGFGVDSLLIDPLGNPGAFGLSELGDSLRLTSVDSLRIRENIDAVHVIDQDRIILSTAGSAVLGVNALSFRDGDLVQYDKITGIASLVFSESIFLDPTGLFSVGENIDAVSVLSDGDLVLSTAGAARIGALSFRDGDLVRYNTTTGVATLLLSADVFTGGGDIDAVHVVEDAGEIVSYVVSTDGPVTIAGVSYDDGDLIKIDAATLTATKYLSEAIFSADAGSTFVTENIDAVSLGTGDEIVLSTNGDATIEDLAVSLGNGDVIELRPGSTPNLAAGDLGVGASSTFLFLEVPEAGVTFYGEAAGYREKVDFTGAEREVTFGLYEKSDGLTDFVAMIDSTKGGANGDPRVGPIVFNEVMYNPAGGGMEFIELLNISEEPVNLAGWAFTSGIGFTFPDSAADPEDLIVEPGELVLVVPVADHSVPSGVAVFGPYTSVLNNGGEKIELSRPGEPDPDGTVPMIEVVRLAYEDVSPWPVEADGAGWSLQLKQTDLYGNDPNNWGITIPGGTMGDFVIAPRVGEVLLWGSGWSQDMLDRLAADGLGTGGVSIPAGLDQFNTLAWSGIDRISIRFVDESGNIEDVDVTSGDLDVLGVNTAEYEFDGFSYDPASGTATWSLQQPVRADKLRLVLSGQVKDTSGLPLDGDWTDGAGAFPSGNGAIDSNDDFRFRVNVLAGDVVPDGGVSVGSVDRRDLIEVIHHLGGSTAGGPYDPRVDVNADGLIDVDDLREVLLLQGTNLPSGDPRISSGNAPVIATDAVFDRLGAGPASPPAALAAASTSLQGSSEDSVSRRRRPSEINIFASTEQRFSRRRAGGARRTSVASVDAAFTVEPSMIRERITSSRRGRRDG